MTLVRTKIIEKVFCTLQVEGTHNWPNCQIDEVEYLKHPHRHLFGIKATMIVKHGDRDVEFIELKHKIQNYLKSKYYNHTKNIHMFGHQSCEMIARELMNVFDLIECEVNEDNENGSILTKIEEFK